MHARRSSPKIAQYQLLINNTSYSYKECVSWPLQLKSREYIYIRRAHSHPSFQPANQKIEWNAVAALLCYGVVEAKEAEIEALITIIRSICPVLSDTWYILCSPIHAIYSMEAVEPRKGGRGLARKLLAAKLFLPFMN